MGDRGENTTFRGWFRQLGTMPILIIDTSTMPALWNVNTVTSERGVTLLPVIDVETVNRHGIG